jgi:hypothetical protein
VFGAPQPEPAFSTPCPEPERGWQVIDESRASRETRWRAVRYARSQSSFGGAWSVPIDRRRGTSDPTRLVLNISFTGDVGRHEEAIREWWGGALCVSNASISATDLARVESEIETEIEDLLWALGNAAKGTVEITVPVDDGLQRRFDRRYGPGVVEVNARLRPVVEN